MGKQNEGNALSKATSKFLAIFLTFALMVTMVFCLPKQAEAASFPDVKKNSWYAKEGWVKYVTDKSIMSGYDNGKFGPEDRLTRGQAAVILYRYDQNKTAKTTKNKVKTKFSDVKSGKYYTAAVKWASDNKIVTGYSGTKKFGPEDHVTREQLSTMIARYAGTKGENIKGANTSRFNKLSGKNKVSKYAKESMVWCTANNIIGGIGGKKLDPQGYADRAQMAKIITVTTRDVLDKPKPTPQPDKPNPKTDFDYKIEDGWDGYGAYITEYKGKSTSVVVPNKIDNVNVVSVELERWYVDSKLTSLDVSACEGLKSLLCGGNNLTSLDISKCLLLEDLQCGGNQFSSLDLSKNSALQFISCYGRNLTSLDVSNNANLKSLFCNYSKLTSLDVSKNPNLVSLFCGYNELTVLDVSKNTVLEILDCSDNQLNTLDVGKNHSLRDLSCSQNKLTSLDISKNSALESLLCSQNKLTSLDIGKNNMLIYLDCSYNKISNTSALANWIKQEEHDGQIEPQDA